MASLGLNELNIFFQVALAIVLSKLAFIGQMISFKMVYEIEKFHPLKVLTLCHLVHSDTYINSYSSEQNGHHFRRYFQMHEKSIKISLKCVRKGPTDDNPALIEIMAWHQIGDKPLSEPMLTQFLVTLWHC